MQKKHHHRPNKLTGLTLGKKRNTYANSVQPNKAFFNI